jgi:hypothetical protein
MKVSPIKAISNYCKGCICDPLAGGNWREQVEGCTVTKCELYELRPISFKSQRIRKEDDLAALPQHQREIVLKRNQNAAQTLAKTRANMAASNTNSLKGLIE